MNTDAFHILRPTDNGIGLFKAMREALLEAGITPSEIDSINSHATSTPAGDLSEAYCIKRLLGNKNAWTSLEELSKIVPEEALVKEAPIQQSQLARAIITAPKGHIGHTFCAAGAVESIFAIKSIEKNTVPQILNLENPLD